MSLNWTSNFKLDLYVTKLNLKLSYDRKVLSLSENTSKEIWFLMWKPSLYHKLQILLLIESPLPIRSFFHISKSQTLVPIENPLFISKIPSRIKKTKTFFVFSFSYQNLLLHSQKNHSKSKVNFKCSVQPIYYSSYWIIQPVNRRLIWFTLKSN